MYISGTLRVLTCGTPGFGSSLVAPRGESSATAMVKIYNEPLTVSMVSDVTPSTTSTGAVGSSYGCWKVGLEL